MCAPLGELQMCCAGRIEISAQNHNYAVNPETFDSGVEVSHINLNDGTCAGIVFPALQVWSFPSSWLMLSQSSQGNMKCTMRSNCPVFYKSLWDFCRLACGEECLKYSHCPCQTSNAYVSARDSKVTDMTLLSGHMLRSSSMDVD